MQAFVSYKNYHLSVFWKNEEKNLNMEHVKGLFELWYMTSCICCKYIVSFVRNDDKHNREQILAVLNQITFKLSWRLNFLAV
jgi:hypothetical protein